MEGRRKEDRKERDREELMKEGRHEGRKEKKLKTGSRREEWTKGGR